MLLDEACPSGHAHDICLLLCMCMAFQISTCRPVRSSAPIDPVAWCISQCGSIVSNRPKLPCSNNHHCHSASFPNLVSHVAYGRQLMTFHVLATTGSFAHLSAAHINSNGQYSTLHNPLELDNILQQAHGKCCICSSSYRMCSCRCTCLANIPKLGASAPRQAEKGYVTSDACRSSTKPH